MVCVSFSHSIINNNLHFRFCSNINLALKIYCKQSLIIKILIVVNLRSVPKEKQISIWQLLFFLFEVYVLYVLNQSSSRPNYTVSNEVILLSFTFISQLRHGTHVQEETGDPTSADVLPKALDHYNSTSDGYKKTSQLFGVPRSTLQDYVKKNSKLPKSKRSTTHMVFGYQRHSINRWPGV